MSAFIINRYEENGLQFAVIPESMPQENDVLVQG